MSEEFKSRHSRNSRNMIILCSVILIAIAAFAFASFSNHGGQNLPQQAVARIEKKSGEILIKRSGITVPYEEGFMILSGDTIRCRHNTSLKISYLDDATQIQMHPNTSILFDSNQGGKRLRISGGKAALDIPAQPEGKPMLLATNCVEATVVRAGEITISVNGPEDRFEVKSGRLKIRRLRDSRIKEVPAGEIYSTQDSGGKIEFGSINDEFLSSENHQQTEP